MTGAEAKQLLQDWHRLVARVAEMHGGKVDNVFDLPRILRVPGTHRRYAGRSREHRGGAGCDPALRADADDQGAADDARSGRRDPFVSAARGCRYSAICGRSWDRRVPQPKEDENALERGRANGGMAIRRPGPLS